MSRPVFRAVLVLAFAAVASLSFLLVALRDRTHSGGALAVAGPGLELSGGEEAGRAPEGVPGERVVAGGSIGRVRVRGRIEVRDPVPGLAGVRITASDSGGALLADAIADARLAFELALPAVPTSVVLMLEHRFLRLPRPVPVDLRRIEGEIVLHAEVGARLHGEVRLPPADAGGESCAYDEVEVRLGSSIADLDPERGASTARGRSAVVSADGRFEFPAVPCGVRHDLLATHAELAPCELPCLELAPGEDRKVVLQLHRALLLRGIVQDERGRAIPGVDVELRRFGVLALVQGSLLGKTSTAADGAFELTRPAAGSLLLALRKDGLLPLDYGPVRAAGAVGAARADELVLTMAEGLAIEGVVRWADGTPAADVEVVANRSDRFRSPVQSGPQRARSDEHGGFAIAGLRRGAHEIEARLERASDGVLLGRGTRSEVKAGASDAEVTLVATCGLRGRVVDASAAPVGRFELCLAERQGSQAEGYWRGGPEPRRTVESPDGTFLVEGLLPGAWFLDVRARGLAAVEGVPVSLPRAPEEILEIRLPAPAVLAGVVRSPWGEPLAGALVRTQSAERFAPSGAAGEAQGSTATSEWDGAFCVRDLPLGRLSVWAEASGFAPSERVAVELAAGQPRDGVTLTLRRGALVRGVVYDRSGQIAAGAPVSASLVPDFMRSTHADGRGCFELTALAPGEWQVMAFRSGTGDRPPRAGAPSNLSVLASAVTEVVELKDGDEVELVLGTPAPEQVRVHGRVLAADDASRAVVFMPVAAPGADASGLAETDAQGRYEIELAHPGRYRVLVRVLGAGSAEAPAEFPAEIPDVDACELDFELPLGSIAGRVLDPQRRGLARAALRLFQTGAIPSDSPLGGVYLLTTADEEGRYAITGLAAGRYALVASGPTGAPALGQELRAPIELRADQVLRGVDFELDRPGEVEVAVRGADGAPVPGAHVFLRDAAGSALDRMASAVTDSEGRAWIRGLAPGDYGVLARTRDAASSECRVTVPPAGERAFVSVSLAAAAFLEVAVIDEQGLPLPAELLVVDERGHQVNGMVEEDLVAELPGETHVVGPLPPGRYQVSASGYDGGSAVTSVVVAAHERKRVSLFLSD